MMRAVFSELARRELDDATIFLEVQNFGLGRRFRTEILSAVRRIQSFPQAWPIERPDIRKCVIRRFPYKILYSIEADHIFIIAIAHQHRHPDYWVDT